MSRSCITSLIAEFLINVLSELSGPFSHLVDIRLEWLVHGLHHNRICELLCNVQLEILSYCTNTLSIHRSWTLRVLHQFWTCHHSTVLTETVLVQQCWHRNRWLMEQGFLNVRFLIIDYTARLVWKNLRFLFTFMVNCWLNRANTDTMAATESRVFGRFFVIMIK